MDEWGKVEKASTDIYSKLPDDTKPAFFQLVHHPVSASANAARMVQYILLRCNRIIDRNSSSGTLE